MSNSKSNKQFPIGFTAFDNRIFYMQDRLSPNAFSLFIRIYRMSEGYDSTPKSLSNTYFQTACNVSKNTVTRSVKELELLGVVNVQRRARANSLYSINLETVDNLYKSSINESQKDISLEPSDVTDVSHNRVGTKQNLIKQNNNKENTTLDINIPFDVFWDLYDYKKNKSLCVTKWHSITDEERTLTIESLDKYKQSTPDKIYRKYPLNYLENECWNDEHIVIVDNQNYAHNNKYNSNNAHNNNVFSPSHKEFEPVIPAQEVNSTKHTKDDLECNLEALGISSDTTTDDTDSDTTVDIVALSSQVHWSELKARGMLKNPVNTNAVIPNTDTDKKINEFLARNSSKRFGKDIA